MLGDVTMDSSSPSRSINSDVRPPKQFSDVAASSFGLARLQHWKISARSAALCERYPLLRDRLMHFASFAVKPHSDRSLRHTIRLNGTDELPKGKERKWGDRFRWGRKVLDINRSPLEGKCRGRARWLRASIKLRSLNAPPSLGRKALDGLKSRSS